MGPEAPLQGDVDQQLEAAGFREQGEVDESMGKLDVQRPWLLR